MFSLQCVDDGDVLGQTYLMYAVQGKSEQLECFNFLLSLKFNINHQANGKNIQEKIVYI